MISNKGVSIAQAAAAFSRTAIALNTLHIGLFKGEQQPMQRLFDNSAPSNIYTWTNIATQLGLVQSNFLGSISCPALTPIFNPTARTLTLPLAPIAANLVGRADGVPTYYVARIGTANAANTWAGFNAAGTITGALWTGTVGDEDSDAELRFVSGEIKLDQAYRFLDLSIQI